MSEVAAACIEAKACWPIDEGHRHPGLTPTWAVMTHPGFSVERGVDTGAVSLATDALMTRHGSHGRHRDWILTDRVIWIRTSYYVAQYWGGIRPPIIIHAREKMTTLEGGGDGGRQLRITLALLYLHYALRCTGCRQGHSRVKLVGTHSEVTHVSCLVSMHPFSCHAKIVGLVFRCRSKLCK